MISPNDLGRRARRATSSGLWASRLLTAGVMAPKGPLLCRGLLKSCRQWVQPITSRLRLSLWSPRKIRRNKVTDDLLHNLARTLLPSSASFSRFTIYRRHPSGYLRNCSLHRTRLEATPTRWQWEYLDSIMTGVIVIFAITNAFILRSMYIACIQA